MTIYYGSRYVTAPVASPPRAVKIAPLYPGPDNPAVDAYLIALAKAAAAKSKAPKSAQIPAPVPTLFPKRPGRKNTTQTPVAFHTHLVVQQDRFDLLAAKFLGDPKKWWMIADLNPEVFFPFDDLVPGTTIRYPASATASYVVNSQTFLPQVFARVFDGQSKPA